MSRESFRKKQPNLRWQIRLPLDSPPGRVTDDEKTRSRKAVPYPFLYCSQRPTYSGRDKSPMREAQGGLQTGQKLSLFGIHYSNVGSKP